ncbi:MAG: efflux RND transporter periplasmic adaptor subunit, partial [Cupriavidus sp.]|nr:efflux RND transporter periplasmic adaptor subunit [Cupriavidus sp.]
RQVPVTRGPKIGELQAVQGVKPGETVVLAPADKLADGARVTVTKK